MTRGIYLLIGIALLGLSLLSTNNSTSTAKTQDSNPLLYKVVKVVDGDTLDVKRKNEVHRLRLIGIDTPETVDPRKPVQCFGLEASKKTKELLNENVYLESDPSQGNTDKYGRLLRYVILEDGTNFNKKLINEGFAFEYTYNIPYKYQAEFKQSEASAKDNNLGLWNPSVCDNKIKDTINYSFYLSKKAKSKYYCETDNEWKNLDKDNLLKYESEENLKNDFPNLKLNKPC